MSWRANLGPKEIEPRVLPQLRVVRMDMDGQFISEVNRTQRLSQSFGIAVKKLACGDAYQRRLLADCDIATKRVRLPVDRETMLQEYGCTVRDGR